MKLDTEQLDLNDLTIFLTLAETCSFTQAAERLGCAKARVSLVIKRLEERLGVLLFNRSTRKVALTQAGEELFLRCQPLLEQLGQAINEVGSPTSAMTGTLRISAPTIYSAKVLAPVLHEFKQRYPQLRIELRSSDRVSDLLEEGIDLAIRIGWLKDSSLRSTQLGQFQQYLIAAPSYLATHNAPKNPAELTQHQCLTLSILPSAHTWSFRRNQDEQRVQVNSWLSADSVDVLLSLVLDGAGVAVLPTFAVQDALAQQQLQTLLPNWHLNSGGIYAVYPPGRYLSVKARTLVEFLRERIG